VSHGPATPPWHPGVGDRVRIKGTRLTGTVHHINVDRDEPRFVIPDARPDRSVYWLKELEPIQ
jgi:hypothetical protein